MVANPITLMHRPASLSGARSRFATWARLLFGTPLNASLTILFSAFLAWSLPGLVEWAVLDAVFAVHDPEACRTAEGACWGFIGAKAGQILFGIYPPDQRWRPILVCIMILGLLGGSVWPRFWSRTLLYVWLVALAGVFLLMKGGMFGLPEVPSSSWGGLPVTLILTVVAIGIAFPLAIVLALARRSTLRVARLLAIGLIETIRGLPLLSLLFVASIMLPLFLPEYLLPDKFVRALVALTIFASAYLAEIVRGGLQAIPKGQYEAAEALGLTFWQRQRLIILPQALRIVIPALANTIIVMIKNTSLVLVVGLFDLISSGKAALADPAWPSPAAETYLFIGALYFVLAFSFARFADFLERRTKTGH
jgi:general L-amino acid transport system permease protein